MAEKETAYTVLDRELAFLESTALALNERIAQIKELVRVEREQTRAENERMRVTREFCEAMERRVAETNLRAEETVILSVRGTIIMASRRLLTRVEGSFLKEMFCGRHVLNTVGPQGAVYLDRDPVVFASLLSVMEHPALLPTDPHLRSLLRIEAEFWGLHFLVMIMDNFQANLQAQMGFKAPGLQPCAVVPQPPITSPMADQVVPTAPTHQGPAQMAPAALPPPTVTSAPIKPTLKDRPFTVLSKRHSSPAFPQTSPQPTAGPATSSTRSADSPATATRKTSGHWAKPASSPIPSGVSSAPPTTNGQVKDETSAKNENGPNCSSIALERRSSTGTTTEIAPKRIGDLGPPSTPSTPTPFAAATTADANDIPVGPVRDYSDIRIHKSMLGSGKKEFDDPYAVAVHADTVYVVEGLGKKVSAYLREDHTRIWVEKLVDEGQGIVVGPDGTVFITCKDHRVYIRKPGGQKMRFGGEGKGKGQFVDPLGIAVDKQGRLLVADYMNQRIQLFTQEGKYLTEWKLPQRPFGLAVGPSGDVYVMLMDRFEVACLDPNTGEITRKWGGEGKGSGQFYGPIHMCADGHGQVLVADKDNQKILAFTSTGVFLCEIGVMGVPKLASPTAVAVARDTGVMYVAHAGDGSVKVY